MKITIAIFTWVVYSVITLLAITNIIWGYDKWFSHFYISLVGILISCCGFLVYTIAALQFGSLKKLSGIEKSTIETDGIYMYSRNPQFLGWWLLLFGLFLMNPNYLSLSLLLLGVFCSIIQIIFEEKSLLLKYGSQYKGYMSSVRRII